MLYEVITLNELDTENVEPTTHVLPLSNVMREDEVHESRITSYNVCYTKLLRE